MCRKFAKRHVGKRFLGRRMVVWIASLISSMFSRTVHGGVDCYVQKVKETCGEEMAKWEKRLRHALVQFLLIDLNSQTASRYRGRL